MGQWNLALFGVLISCLFFSVLAANGDDLRPTSCSASSNCTQSFCGNATFPSGYYCTSGLQTVITCSWNNLGGYVNSRVTLRYRPWSTSSSPVSYIIKISDNFTAPTTTMWTSTTYSVTQCSLVEEVIAGVFVNQSTLQVQFVQASTGDAALALGHSSWAPLDSLRLVVAQQASITLAQPALGTVWRCGETQSIDWRWTGPHTSFNLSLIQGSTVIKLITFMPTPANVTEASYLWDIPNDIPQAANYRIRVASGSPGSTVTGTSLFFQIQQCLSITAPALLAQADAGEGHFSITWTALMGCSVDDLAISLQFQDANNDWQTERVINGSAPNKGQYLWAVPPSLGIDRTLYNIKIQETPSGPWARSSVFVINPVMQWVTPSRVAALNQTNVTVTLNGAARAQSGLAAMTMRLYENDTATGGPVPVVDLSPTPIPVVSGRAAQTFRWTVPRTVRPTRRALLWAGASPDGSGAWTGAHAWSGHFQVTNDHCIDFTSPPAGAQLESGTPYNVSWVAHCPLKGAYLALYREGSWVANLTGVMANLTGAGASWYNLTLPSLPTGSAYALHLVDSVNADLRGISPEVTVLACLDGPVGGPVAGYMDVFSPAKGAQLQAQQTITIQWRLRASLLAAFQPAEGQLVAVELLRDGVSALSLDATALFSQPAQAAADPVGQLVFTIPENLTTSTRYQVHLTPASHPQFDGYSSVFTLKMCKDVTTIQFRYPLMSTALSTNQPTTLLWDTVGCIIPKVDITLSRIFTSASASNGAILTLATRTPNNGTLAWTPPSTLTDATDYSITIADASSGVTGVSEFFAIRPLEPTPTPSEADFVVLNNGARMPRIGLGTWQSPDAEVKTAVKAAVEAGYRHIDTAYCYQNEGAVGQALEELFAEGKVRREELFITTKLWNTCHRPEHVLEACLRSLHELKLQSLDLYLVHYPIAWKFLPYPKTGFEPDSHPEIDHLAKGKTTSVEIGTASFPFWGPLPGCPNPCHPVRAEGAGCWSLLTGTRWLAAVGCCDTKCMCIRGDGGCGNFIQKDGSVARKTRVPK
ncbi:putative oxidoreductase [Paratrimastix pyriformis]|uniref:Oxidoreductase n=1 Tax=Paratrimastix pyriformis TaxID=342808 RepID=A0ABQ8URJ6_9EUKA|nr:putative oxidoreductase [Paratrimastix pyriformis]